MVALGVRGGAAILMMLSPGAACRHFGEGTCSGFKLTDCHVPRKINGEDGFNHLGYASWYSSSARAPSPTLAAGNAIYQA